MTFEYNTEELERKLQASLLSSKLQAEVMKRLAWYRTQLMLAKSEIRDLKKQVSDDGWWLNPDRMGGAYTEHERDGGWR